MGLFDIFKKKTTINQVQINSDNSTQVQIGVVNTTAPSNVIDMSKHKENFEKVVIDMSKNSKIDMSKHVARVGLAIDYSGSMHSMYNNGAVQDIIERLLPVSLKFDDNGELELWIFSNESEKMDNVTINNYEKCVKNIKNNSRMYMGGTEYAPVLKDMVEHYIKIEPSSIPAFIIFITDGDNSDEGRTNEIVRKLSEYNIFVQFIGIGNDSFSYLKKLDNLSGRKNDNTGFISVKDINKMDDTQLYTELLRQYKDWLTNRK